MHNDAANVNGGREREILIDWEETYRVHSPGVYQYLLSLSNGSFEAEDLLQETFIRAIKSESTLREPGKVHSWLMTIARNLFLDSVRKKSKWKAVGYAAEPEEMETIPDSKPNPEDFAMNSDFKSHLHNVLSHLAETYQTAFVLGVMQRLSYQEIGDITGWSMSMVKTNIFRARKKVAEALGEFRI